MRFSFVVSAGFGYKIPRLFETDSSFTEFENALRLLKQQGFDGVELNLSQAEEPILRRIHGSVGDAGFQVSAIGTGLTYLDRGLSFADPDSSKRERAIEIVKKLIGFASIERAVVIIGLIRGGQSTVDATARFSQSLEECDRIAAEHNVRIALEAINRYETSSLNTAADAAKLIRDLRLRATGLLLDSFHMNIEEVSIEATIREYYPMITHFHIADSNRSPPGHGHLQVESQLKILADLGYQGCVSAEVIPKPDNANAVKETASFLRRHNFLPHR